MRSDSGQTVHCLCYVAVCVSVFLALSRFIVLYIENDCRLHVFRLHEMQKAIISVHEHFVEKINLKHQ